MKFALVVGLTAVSLSCTQSQPGGSQTGSSAAQTAETADPRPDAERSAQPMTTEPTTLSSLVRSSPLVFLGRLRAQTAEKDAKGLIVTRNEFDVERVIAGASTDKAITLRVLGGTVDGETMSMSHMPEFSVDRRYIVFTDPRRTTYDPVTGDRLGVFVVVGDGVYTYDGRALLDVENGVLRTGRSAVSDANAPGTREREAAQAENPRTSGGIVSMQRATEPPETAMTPDAFARAVTAAVGR